MKHKNFSKAWYCEVTKNCALYYEEHSKFPELVQPTKADELSKAIAEIKCNRKGADYEGIHPLMMKVGGYQFHINLLILFNAILKTGAWPFSDNLVILLKKVGRKDYSSPANYRPITIGSVCGKVFERIIEKRLRKLAEQHKWIPPSQHGFRAGKSTSTYLAQLVSTIQHNRAIKQPTAGVFVDLQKAFDSIWHDGMIYMLAELGFKGKFLTLIDNFLKTRNIRLKVNDYISDAKPCNIGLPQGSILAPLLFLLYTRNFLEGIEGLSLQYADDCSIVVSKSNENELVETLKQNCQHISQWLTKWRMSANCAKTDVIWFKGKSYQLEICNEKLNNTTETKVLGVIIDQNMSFIQQKANAQGIVTKKWNLLTPFINAGLVPLTSRKIFTSVIVPKARYNSYIWDPKCETTTYKCLKDMLGVPFNPPTEALYQLTDIKPPELKNLSDIFTLCKLSSKDDTLQNILAQRKSELQMRIKTCLAKLCGRNYSTHLSPEDFKKSKIDIILKTESRRRWKARLSNGDCSTGLLNRLPPDHLEKHHVPLWLPRQEVALLCSMLTGHSKLQCHLYKLKLTFTPTCTCLKDDETVEHYLYECTNYLNLRIRLNPNPNNYIDMIEYIKNTHRF